MGFNPNKDYKSVWETVTERQPNRTKIWKGKRRTAWKYNKPWWDHYTELFKKYKVGDYIGTCEGFNRKICKIEYEWTKLTRHTSVLNDIIFEDKNGRLHWASGMG